MAGPFRWAWGKEPADGGITRAHSVGSARVSTTDQNLEIQEAALRAAEMRSGTSTAGREELRTVLDFLRKGDVLMVTRIDRLARSIGDLQDIVRAVKAKCATLKATEQPIDTSTAAGKCFLHMLGIFAEFETNLRKERQLEGIAKAREGGVYKGRPGGYVARDPTAVHLDGSSAPHRCGSILPLRTLQHLIARSR